MAMSRSKKIGFGIEEADEADEVPGKSSRRDGNASKRSAKSNASKISARSLYKYTNKKSKQDISEARLLVEPEDLGFVSQRDEENSLAATVKKGKHSKKRTSLDQCSLEMDCQNSPKE